MSEEGVRETRTLACVLTDAEIRHRADELARKVADHGALEQAKKDQAKEIGLEIAEVEATISHLASQVRNRAEDRLVDCVWQATEDSLELVRTDTGEVVASRLLTPAERQGKLFRVPGAESQA